MKKIINNKDLNQVKILSKQKCGNINKLNQTNKIIEQNNNEINELKFILEQLKNKKRNNNK